jgi:rRNA-processing protein FCF1
MKENPKAQKKPLKVILDSNALFTPLQFKIDIFEELKTLLNRRFEPVLLSPVRQELERLSKESSPQMRKNAALALKLVEKCKVVVIDETGTDNVDDAITKVASRGRCAVFTNDRQLRKKLRDINVPVIYVRQKSRLTIDGRP